MPSQEKKEKWEDGRKEQKSLLGASVSPRIKSDICFPKTKQRVIKSMILMRIIIMLVAYVRHILLPE